MSAHGRRTRGVRLIPRPATVAAAVAAIVLLGACGGGTTGPSLGEAVPSTPTPGTLVPTTAVNQADVRIEAFEVDGRIGDIQTELPLGALAGQWVVAGGQLATAQIPQLVPFYLTADSGSSEGLRQVTMPVTANGAGLMFRVVDARNHWRVTAAPGFATWAVSKIVDGQEMVMGNVGLASAEDGTTIGVLLDDDNITYLVNGQPRQTITDADLATATGFGVVAIGGQSALARWDDMVVIAIDYERAQPDDLAEGPPPVTSPSGGVSDPAGEEPTVAETPSGSSGG